MVFSFSFLHVSTSILQYVLCILWHIAAGFMSKPAIVGGSLALIAMFKHKLHMYNLMIFRILHKTERVDSTILFTATQHST